MLCIAKRHFTLQPSCAILNLFSRFEAESGVTELGTNMAHFVHAYDFEAILVWNKKTFTVFHLMLLHLLYELQNILLWKLHLMDSVDRILKFHGINRLHQICQSIVSERL